MLGHCYVIIFKIYNLETSPYIGIIIDKLAERAYEADDLLRHIGAGSGLCGKNIGVRSEISVGVLFDCKIL